MANTFSPSSQEAHRNALPRLSSATRGLISGGIVAFVSFLFAAELMLGYGNGGHEVRVVLLGVSFVVCIALAGMLHPDELPERPLLAPDGEAKTAGNTAFSVPVQVSTE
jgi:predicted phage tail protein